MTRIEDPVVRRTLVDEIDRIARLWAAQSDQERARGLQGSAAISAGKAMACEQIARDIEQAT